MKIDVFAHIMTKKYLEALSKKAQQDYNFVKSAVWVTKKNSPLNEIDVRSRLMQRYPDVVQILTLGAPPLETVVGAKDSIDLARLANNELAELVSQYPNLFVGAVACLPLLDIEASLKEIERTIVELKFRGIQMFSNVNGEPLSSPKFKPLYEKMAKYDLPIWIHPWNQPDRDLGGCFGWPYETSMGVKNLVSAGIFLDFPDIKFIVHHCGAMVPFLAERIRTSWPRIMREEKTAVIDPLDHFRKFYVDTAVYGNAAALTCGYDFFGADHMLFGTDAPLGAGDGECGLTLETINSVEQMNITEDEKQKIFRNNVMKLLRVDL